MNRSILPAVVVSTITLIAISISRGDDAPTTHAGASADAAPAAPFTGAEEPRPDFFITGRLTTASRMERAAFLGVGANAVDAALRSQLDLPRGVGLVVGYVEKGSPADQAGVQQHDIIEKLNDQLLVNAPQLATLIRTFKAGDEVTLTIIRKGKALTLTAKLVERDLPPLADAGDPFTINFATEPAGQEKQELILKRMGNAGDVVSFDQPNQRLIRISPDSTRMIQRDDGTNQIQLNQRGDSKTVTIRDAAGKVLFDGPFNTPEEQSKMPAELREKVLQMEQGIEFKPMTPTTGPSDPKADASQPSLRQIHRSSVPA